jgi:hypothetical protein
MFFESDRGAILVGLAEIDDRLEELLETCMKASGAGDSVGWMLDPMGGNRPLGNLHNRSVLARCLGIIDDELLAVIDEMRLIRNNRAHGATQSKLVDEDVEDLMLAWSVDLRRIVQQTTERLPEHQSYAMRTFLASTDQVVSELRQTLSILKIHILRVEIPKEGKGPSKHNYPAFG